MATLLLLSLSLFILIRLSSQITAPLHLPSSITVIPSPLPSPSSSLSPTQLRSPPKPPPPLAVVFIEVLAVISKSSLQQSPKTGDNRNMQKYTTAEYRRILSRLLYHRLFLVKVGQSPPLDMTPINTTLSWQSYIEDAASSVDDNTFTLDGLYEQINITRDATDYLWYMTDITIGPNEEFLKNRSYPLLTIDSAGHALHVFIKGQLSGR